MRLTDTAVKKERRLGGRLESQGGTHSGPEQWAQMAGARDAAERRGQGLPAPAAPEPSCEVVDMSTFQRTSPLGKVKNACPPFAVTGAMSYLFRKHFHQAQVNSFCHSEKGSAASCEAQLLQPVLEKRVGQRVCRVSLGGFGRGQRDPHWGTRHSAFTPHLFRLLPGVRRTASRESTL